MKIQKCRWLKPLLVAQIEFQEWTSDGHLGIQIRRIAQRQRPATDSRIAQQI
jgi:ATP-dependent DNA ligase